MEAVPDTNGPPDVAEALERLVAALPDGGERRAGQQAMARAVAEAIDAERHLIVQAGTGTGKSLGYLVPALLSGRRVVVSTATKALQDQLARKDLPFIAQHLGREVTFTVLKGRSNYLCRQRAAEVISGEDQLGLDTGDDTGDGDGGGGDGGGGSRLGREVTRLVAWGRTATSGDRADLPFEPSARAWGAVSVSAMECPGAAHCPAGDECFAEAARLAAETSDVVVVNTHLYGAHLASGRHVLPPHDVVVFDEAHELEDIAAATLGLELTAGRFRALAFATRRLAGDEKAQPLLDVATRFEAAFAPLIGARIDPRRDDIATFLALCHERAGQALGAVRATTTDDPAKARALQSGGHLQGDIAFVQQAGTNQVVWVEGRDLAPVVRIAPIDVGQALTERLWSVDDEEAGRITAVCTSATIPPNLADRIGLAPDTFDALDAGSPFDFETNALLYCAAHLPDPRQPGYEAAMHAELRRLLVAAGGRTLALFTSWRAMHAAVDALAGELPFTVLYQGELPKPVLLSTFMLDESSCLFATMGFWQGVDVPGPALSQVVIDRLPFARPDEPLLQARRERAGADAFRLIDVPRAATLLAQGAGRLIRTATDRGVVAVLDPRLATARYRWALVNALPPMRRTRHFDDVEAFWRAAD